MNNLTTVLDVKFMSCKNFLTEYFGEKEQGWKINLLNYPLLVYCNEGRVISIEFDGERDSDVYLKNESGWEYEMSWAVPDLIVISPKKNIFIDFTQLPDKVSFLPCDEEVSGLFLGGQIKQQKGVKHYGNKP